MKINSYDMKKNKRGEIATIITLGAIIVLGLVSFISAKFLSKNQLTTKSNAEGVSCTANTVPPNAPPFPANCDSVTTIGKCVKDTLHNNLYPFPDPWIKCGTDKRWYGPCQDKQTCLSGGVNSQTNTGSQQSAQPAGQTSQSNSQPSTGACGGTKTGYGNCSAVSPAGSCVYRSYAAADPHYFNQWIYCCGADNFWYAKDTNSQDPAKGWQSKDECTQAGGTTPASSSSTSSSSQQPANPPGPDAVYTQTNCQEAGVGENTDLPLYEKDGLYYKDQNGTNGSQVSLSTYCPSSTAAAVQCNCPTGQVCDACVGGACYSGCRLPTVTSSNCEHLSCKTLTYSNGTKGTKNINYSHDTSTNLYYPSESDCTGDKSYQTADEMKNYCGARHCSELVHANEEAFCDNGQSIYVEENRADYLFYATPSDCVNGTGGFNYSQNACKKAAELKNHGPSDCQETYQCSSINKNYTDVSFGTKTDNGTTNYYYWDKSSNSCAGNPLFSVDLSSQKYLQNYIELNCEGLHKKIPPQLVITNQCENNAVVHLVAWHPYLIFNWFGPRYISFIGVSSTTLSTLSKTNTVNNYQTDMTVGGTPCGNGFLDYTLNSDDSQHRSIELSNVDCNYDGHINNIVLEGDQYCN